LSSKALRFDFHSCGIYIELGIMPLFRVPVAPKKVGERRWSMGFLGAGVGIMRAKRETGAGCHQP